MACIKKCREDYPMDCWCPRDKLGKTWHPELIDKVKPTRTHIHWCMRNCEGSTTILRASLLNIVQHCKNVHDDCHPTT